MLVSFKIPSKIYGYVNEDKLLIEILEDDMVEFIRSHKIFIIKSHGSFKAGNFYNAKRSDEEEVFSNRTYMERTYYTPLIFNRFVAVGKQDIITMFKMMI